MAVRTERGIDLIEFVSSISAVAELLNSAFFCTLSLIVMRTDHSLSTAYCFQHTVSRPSTRKSPWQLRWTHCQLAGQASDGELPPAQNMQAGKLSW